MNINNADNLVMGDVLNYSLNNFVLAVNRLCNLNTLCVNISGRNEYGVCKGYQQSSLATIQLCAKNIYTYLS